MTNAPENPTEEHSVALERAIEAIRAGEENRLGHIREYLNVLSSGMEAFRIDHENVEGHYDEAIFVSITNFIPHLVQFTELLFTITQYETDENYADVLHKFFEGLIPYLYPPENVSRWRETDFDNFKFIIHELFLYTVAILLKEEKFEVVNYFISKDYYVRRDSHGERNVLKSYSIFYDYIKSFEIRNQRLNLNMISLRTVTLEKRAQNSRIDFKYLIQADFILFVRKEIELSGIGNRWYPFTLNYFGWSGNGTFEIFLRAESVKYFDKIKGLIGINDKNDITRLSDTYNSNKRNRIKIDHSEIHLEPFMNFGNLATKP